MDHPVGQRQIGQRVLVDVAAEIVIIAGERLSQSMMQIHHAGHTVEAEAVDPVFVQIKAAVGEQEVQHLRLRVVEAQRIPAGMLAPAPLVEIGVAGAVELRQPLDLVLHRVGVHQVDDYPEAAAVGGVHQRLELIRRAETARDREEIRNVVAEAAVVGVSHHRHQLDGVVAARGDLRQDFFAVFVEGADLRLLLRHADVGFVDQRRGRRGR